MKIKLTKINCNDHLFKNGPLYNSAFGYISLRSPLAITSTGDGKDARDVCMYMCVCVDLTG